MLNKTELQVQHKLPKCHQKDLSILLLYIDKNLLSDVACVFYAVTVAQHWP